MFEYRVSEYFHIAVIFFDYEKINSTVHDDWRIESLFALNQVQYVFINSFIDFANATHIFFGPSDFYEYLLFYDLKAVSLFNIVPNVARRFQRTTE
jgi:hypothetical protein